ncbi:MAG: DUF1905 domain-containing protein [Chitinophagaceae bacterium]|nr:DUF1905 domain-containing protein [Chitinophagaceae bacterium]
MNTFEARIEIIGVNPYVLLPEEVLRSIFDQAEKSSDPLPVKGNINGQPFIQTLVKYSGLWRLYLNTPMRKSTDTQVGDVVKIELWYDAAERTEAMHPKLEIALKNDAVARQKFDSLSASLQKELLRYINRLKSAESIDRNIIKTVQFLHGKQRHIGRAQP